MFGEPEELVTTFHIHSHVRTQYLHLTVMETESCRVTLLMYLFSFISALTFSVSIF